MCKRGLLMRKCNINGNYSNAFFKSSLEGFISTLRFITTLLRTKRPAFRPSLHSRRAATSSSINKPQTTNGKYLHATRVNIYDDATRKCKQFTATHR